MIIKNSLCTEYFLCIVYTAAHSVVKIQRSRSLLGFDLPTGNNIFTSKSYKAPYRQPQ